MLYLYLLEFSLYFYECCTVRKTLSIFDIFIFCVSCRVVIVLFEKFCQTFMMYVNVSYFFFENICVNSRFINLRNWFIQYWCSIRKIWVSIFFFKWYNIPHFIRIIFYVIFAIIINRDIDTKVCVWSTFINVTCWIWNGLFNLIFYFGNISKNTFQFIYLPSPFFFE